MPDENPAGEPQEETTPQENTDEQLLEGAKNPDAVSKALKAEREAAKAARKEAEALQAKVKEFEDRDKSELDKLAERAAEAEGEAYSANQQALKLRVAYSKGLPMELVDRLQGNSEEEVAEDADRLLKLVRPEPGAGAFDEGAREPAPAAFDMNTVLRRAAGRG